MPRCPLVSVLGLVCSSLRALWRNLGQVRHEVRRNDLPDALGALVREMKEVVEQPRVLGQLARKLDEEHLSNRRDLPCHIVGYLEQTPFERAIAPPVNLHRSEVDTGRRIPRITE